MSENTTPAAAAPEATTPAAPKIKQNPARDPKWGRARLRAVGRKKRKAKLLGDREVAKAHFDAKSKRSTEKKSAFRKKKTKKK